jgi:hypothetical protein
MIFWFKLSQSSPLNAIQAPLVSNTIGFSGISYVRSLTFTARCFQPASPNLFSGISK